MSITGAINSATSALTAQSSALAIVSDNLANSSTVGYKTNSASFASLVTGTSTTAYSSGGVSASARANITEQGLLTSTSNSTDLAIDGAGFFAVSGDSGGTDVYYARNGAFSIDSNGYLANNGYYLLGWATDADGNIIGGTTEGSLEVIDTRAITASVGATTEMSIQANLPAEAAVGDSFETSLEVYDSLGTPSTLTATWTKTAANTWELAVSDPQAADGTTTGTVTSSAITVTFNSDGSLSSTNPDPATISIAGWTTGAADSTITVNLGETDSTNGLTQYSSGADDPVVSIDAIVQDGLAYGALSSIEITDDGSVVASFDNGQQKTIYKIPVVTFNNANGLQALSNGVYSKTTASGSGVFQMAGTGSAGSIVGGALEASTTDTSSEFSNLMAAQQAYSAAAQIISAAGSMFDTLMSAVR